ncbi:MAG: cytochrome P450 [Spirochaetota bacterium]
MQLWQKAKDTYYWYNNPYAYLVEKMQQQGLSFDVDIAILGKVCINANPQFIQLVKEGSLFCKGKGVEALSSFLGKDSLIVKDEEQHSIRRKTLAPIFSTQRVARYDNILIQETQKCLQQLPKGKEFSVYEFTSQVLLRVILQFLLGPKAEAELLPAVALVEKFLQSFQSPLFLFLKPLQFDWGQFSPWGRALQNRTNLQNYILTEIEKKRNAHEDDNSALYSLLHTDEDRQTLPNATIVSEIFSLLLFGHDTGAASLAWLFAHAYQSPKVIDTIKSETYDVFTDDSRKELGQYTYLQACVKESMRLSPVVVHLTRQVKQDFSCAGRLYRKGETVIPCTYLSHHNAEVFPNSQRFLPERFLTKQDFSNSYYPFGLSQRICIGKSLVLRQMPLILATCIQKAKLRLAPGYLAKPVRKFVLLIPDAGTRMLKE